VHNDLKARPETPAVWIVLLMAAALLINYIDRGNLATVAPQIQHDLKLTSTQLGLLLGAFFYTYVLFMAPVGWLSERYGAKPVLAIGVAIWSAATLLTGFVGGFVSLFLLRLALGVGESVAFPATSKMLASKLDPAHTGLANGVLGFGYLFGPAIGTVLGGYLVVRYNWRWTFFVFGGLSLLWLIPWLRTRVHEPVLAHRQDDPVAADAPTYPELLRQRGLWGASLGHFAANYNFYFILAWLPTYLETSRGFSVEKMAAVASAAYGINAISALAGGWFSDRWVQSGRSATVAYKSLMGLNHLFSIFCMAGLVLLPEREAIACLFGYEVVLGLASPGVFAIPQIMAGPTATGRWVGIQNLCGNLSGLVAAPVTGLLVDLMHGRFEGGFALAALVNVLGLVGWIGIMPGVTPIDWKAARVARAAASAG
jgi:MFS family permease